MNGNSIIEMYTSLFGWMMYNRIWDVLNDTGIVYVPFILMLFMNYHRLKTSGRAEGVQAFSNAFCIQVIVTTLVFSLFALPLIPVTIGNVSSTRVSVECGVATTTVTPTTDHSTYASTGAFASLGGSTFYMPAGWALWQSLTGAITAASIAGIPCSGDLRGFQLAVGSQVVEDPRTRRELSDFVQQCYGPAIALSQQDAGGLAHPPALSATDLAYMGSPALMAHPLYNSIISTPRPDFPYDATLDDGYGDNGQGHPTCAQWWSGARGNAGLRSRLVGQIDPTVMAKAKSAAVGGMRSVFGGGATDTQIEDNLLHSMMAVSDTKPLTEGSALNADYARNTDHSSSGNGFLGSIAGFVGTQVEGMSHYPKMMMVREALPIAKAFLVMALIMLMPFILVLSGFSPAVVGTLAVAFLGLQMYDLLWAVSFWMDNMLVKTLESDVPSFFGWLQHPQTTMAMDFVTSVLCIILPFIWVCMLGWAGFQTFVFLEGATGKLVDPAGGAGGKGGGLIAKGASKAL